MNPPQTLSLEEIQKILPHRYPFLLVDRITSLEKGKRVVGLKNVSINEPFFQGHFPGRPIMPGVLIAEAMAQVGGILALMSTPGTPGQLLTSSSWVWTRCASASRWSRETNCGSRWNRCAAARNSGK